VSYAGVAVAAVGDVAAEFVWMRKVRRPIRMPSVVIVMHRRPHRRWLLPPELHPHQAVFSADAAMLFDRSVPLDELKPVAAMEVAPFDEAFQLDAVVSGDDEFASVRDRLAVDGDGGHGANAVEVFEVEAVFSPERQGDEVHVLSQHATLMLYGDDEVV